MLSPSINPSADFKETEKSEVNFRPFLSWYFGIPSDVWPAPKGASKAYVANILSLLFSITTFLNPSISFSVNLCGYRYSSFPEKAAVKIPLFDLYFSSHSGVYI